MDRKEKENIRTNLNRQKLKEQGICCKCWKNEIDGNTSSCKGCKEKFKKRVVDAVSAGLCSRCLKNPLHSGKCCRECISKLKDSREEIRDMVFCAYGGYECVCCGESEKSFLSIDHIENNGNLLRKEQGSGNPFYKWLIKNEYPEGYQVLCMNCQFGKSKFGICPHKLVNQDRIPASL